jgi:hypothetical protein
MGNRESETKPTITVTIDMTIATMGRRIKNSTMVGYSFADLG